jgi:ribosome-associated translation inhibitor RaiA
MFTTEFDHMSEATREKVVKKIQKIHRWIAHSGGWNEVWVMAMSHVVFKGFEDMGFDVRLFPRANDNVASAIVEENRVVLTDGEK